MAGETITIQTSEQAFGVDLISPLNIPAGSMGGWRVEIEHIAAGEPVTVASMRNALFMGVKAARATFHNELRVHKLLEGGSLWASDCPQEIYTQWLAHRDLNRHVLVGGLGVGMAATYIAMRPDVDRVTVVEKSPDVLGLVEPHLKAGRKKMRFVEADLYEYLEKPRNFDGAYFDIWCPTGEGAWQDHIVPLRRLVHRTQGRRPVRAWCEEEMRGQIRLALSGPVPDGFGSPSIDEYRHFKTHWVFAEAAQRLGFRRGSMSYQKLLDCYLTAIGTPAWEAAFRWDDWRSP